MRAKKTFLPSVVDQLETREVPSTFAFGGHNFLSPPTSATIPRATFFSLHQTTPSFVFRGTTPTTPSHVYPTGALTPFSLATGNNALPAATNNTGSFLNAPTTTTIPRATFFSAPSASNFAAFQGNTTPSHFYPTNGQFSPFTATASASFPSFLNAPTSSFMPRAIFF